MANVPEQVLQPNSTTIYQFEEKSFTLSPNTYDIGTYLKLLNIKPFQKINIKLREGNYVWNENYVTPENTTIYMVGTNIKMEEEIMLYLLSLIKKILKCMKEKTMQLIADFKFYLWY